MKYLTQISCWWRFLAMSVLLIVHGVGHADTHVLVRYDETGHYLHRVARTTSNSVKLALSLKPDFSSNSAAEVQVHWYDQTGTKLSTTRLADPRLTHAPLLAGSTDLTWTSHQEGAYSLTGPSGAAKVEVILPGWNTPYLPAETWVLEL